MTGLNVLDIPPKEEGPGNGRRVVLIHGAMDRATSFGRVMVHLRDWHVIAYDRRGYAGSFAVGATDRFADQVDDLLEVLDEQPAIVFGHSYAGNVVLAAAERRPDLIPAALVWEPPMPWLGPEVASPVFLRSRTDAPPEDQAEDFMRLMIGEHLWARLPEATRQQRRAEGRTFVAEMRAIDASGRPYNPDRVTIPVISGTGTGSLGRHRIIANAVAESLPRAELVTVDGAQHGVHLSHPTDVVHLLQRLAMSAEEPSRHR